MKLAKPTRSDRNRTMIVGFQKHLSGVPTIILDGKPFTPDALIKVLQTEIDAADATTAAEGAFHKTVAAEKAAVVAGEPVFRALRAFVLNQFKGQTDVLADFGITVTVAKKPDAATKAAAALKAKATRAARGTKGKRQKAGIKGQAQAIPQTPATATKPV
jgi:hypothetical protein